MSTYGTLHELVVEYEPAGPVDDEQEEERGQYNAFGYEVRYILRHPSEGCWPTGEQHSVCPILEQFDAIGMEDALGITSWGMLDGRYRSWTVHLAEGLYEVQCWQEHFSSPNGDDWDGGLYVERAKQDPPPPPKRATLSLAPIESPEHEVRLTEGDI